MTSGRHVINIKDQSFGSLTVLEECGDGKLAEHWDVLQDEATQAESVSGLPMFGA